MIWDCCENNQGCGPDFFCNKEGKNQGSTKQLFYFPYWLGCWYDFRCYTLQHFGQRNVKSATQISFDLNQVDDQLQNMFYSF